MALRPFDLMALKKEMLAAVLKPGWKTSELWFFLAVAAAAQWMALYGHANANFTNILTTLSAGIYLWFRTTHKQDMFGLVAADAQAHVPQLGNADNIEAEVARVLPLLLSSANPQSAIRNPQSAIGSAGGEQVMASMVVSRCPVVTRDGQPEGGEKICMRLRSMAEARAEKEEARKPRASKWAGVIVAFDKFFGGEKPTFDDLFGARDRSTARSAKMGRAMT